MKKALILACTLFSTLFGADFRPRNPMLLIGTIQFPHILDTIPDVRVYCSGYKIDCTTDNRTKRISFTINEDRSQTEFYLLITESFVFETFKNTVKYIKTSDRNPYKFYVLHLKEIPQENPTASQNQPRYTWSIKETAIPFYDGRIPDNTIIVCCNPQFVEHLYGGNAVELPTIVIKPNLVTLVGSETTLHDKSVELLLSSLDYDALHGNLKEQIKTDFGNKTVLTLTT